MIHATNFRDEEYFECLTSSDDDDFVILRSKSDEPTESEEAILAIKCESPSSSEEPLRHRSPTSSTYDRTSPVSNKDYVDEDGFIGSVSACLVGSLCCIAGALSSLCHESDHSII